MAFDGITLHCIRKELQSCFIGGKIHKIYQPSRNEIVLGIYANGNHYACSINISPDCYHLNLTTSKKENPMQAPSFCMLLRKYLIGAKITDMTTPGLERILTFHVEGYNELNDKVTRYLIIELMGKHSNVILTNENHRIIDSLRHVDTSANATRDILPAREYILPANTKQDFVSVSFTTFYETLHACDTTDIAKAISNIYIGCSYTFVKHLLEHLQIDHWNRENAQLFYTTLQNMLHSKTNVFIVPTDKDYTLLPTKEPQDPLSCNFFLDDYYTQKEQQVAFTTYRNSLLKLVWNTLGKTKHVLDNIEKKLQDCAQMDTYRLYGELLTSNLYRLSEEHKTSVVVDNYYENNQPISIPLQEKLSPADNAKRYYKQYKKLKNALEIVTQQKKSVLQELLYLESIVYEIENAKTLEELDTIYLEISENVLFKKSKTSSASSKKTSRHAKPTYLTYTIGDYTLYVGKNNLQNDELTCKIARANDIWFHTKDIHGSHCILQLPAGMPAPDQETILSCARIAAYYSKGKHSSSVPVDYCLVKFVHKPNGAKPGMVIYKHHKTVYVTPALPHKKT